MTVSAYAQTRSRSAVSRYADLSSRHRHRSCYRRRRGEKSGVAGRFLVWREREPCFEFPARKALLAYPHAESRQRTHREVTGRNSANQ
jgi:hypothetical protein